MKFVWDNFSRWKRFKQFVWNKLHPGQWSVMVFYANYFTENKLCRRVPDEYLQTKVLLKLFRLISWYFFFFYCFIRWNRHIFQTILESIWRILYLTKKLRRIKKKGSVLNFWGLECSNWKKSLNCKIYHRVWALTMTYFRLCSCQ